MSDFLHIDDRGDGHDRNNSDCVVIDDDDDDVDCGRVCEDSIGNFSEVNQDSSVESQQDSFENNKHVTDSKVEAEEIGDDYRHNDSDDGDDDDNDEVEGNTDSDSYANGDVKYTCVEIDGEDDSPVIRPKRRNVHRNNFIEVLSISDSPLHTDEVDHVEDSHSLGKSDYYSSPFIFEDHSIPNSPVKAGQASSVEKSHSSHKNDHSDEEDLSISDSALKVGEESYLEESCSYSKSDHENDSTKSRHICDGPMNASKVSYVEESCSRSNNDEDSDSDSVLKTDKVSFIKESHSCSKNDDSDDINKDFSISNCPVNASEVSSVEQSCLPKSDKHCDDSDDDIGIDDEYNDDCDDSHNVNEDAGYEDFMQEPPCFTPLLVNSDEVDGRSESELLVELTSPKSRNDSHQDNDITEDLKISDSPGKSSEVSNNEESCYHRNSDEHCDDRENNVGYENTDNDYKFNDDGDDDIREDVRCQGIEEEEESDHFTSYVSNSDERNPDHGESDSDSKFDDDDDADVSYKGIEAESTRPESSVDNYCSSSTFEDASPGISNSPLKASLTARLFKKYNPEKSESDVDDFERFLQNIKTPKQSRLSGEEREREAGLNAFIVDDNEEDQEEDVFYDPGFTPGLEELSDDDKENDDSIEMLTPASSINTHFKTPSSTTRFNSFASAKSRLLSSNSSRPRSVLDSVITPYANEKDFKKSKDNLVRELFELYNRTVFNNQLPSDFQITWNPRMRSTAGFCYYSKKNNIRMARIELADKVIDSADRLRDTLIHEMCHAAAWMISGVKAGHGAVWKKWTLRAVSVHQDLPPISRCHSYTINAKYTYRCTNNSCANTFGRHSKSVNLEKSRCAYCHSRLELVPQLKKDGTPQSRTPSRFALFVKQNYRRIKSDNSTFSHQDVMKALSSEFGKLSTS